MSALRVAGAGARSVTPRPLRPAVVAVLLAVAAFGLYALTAGPLVGYESETAAVSEGLVTSGQPRVLPGNDLGATGIVGRGGRQYGRAGLAQPVLEAPLAWIGHEIDRASGGTRAQVVALELFEPAMAALTIAAIFAFLVLRGVAEARAVLIAVLCAVATLIWPYSKIGMDTTPMAMLALTALATVWAARRPAPGRFALIGLGFALTVNAKAYVGLIALGLLPLILEPWWRLEPRRRVACLAALAAPVLLGAAVGGWYNWYRTGSVTDFGDPLVTQRLFAMPFSAAGLLISPGKGLVFYSPLVVLGLLGWRELRRSDPRLAWAIAAAIAINVAFASISVAWTDETWGPRYLTETGWLLIVPIAWWLRGRRRGRWLAGLTALAVAVQFVAVFASYGGIIAASRTLSGQPVYLYGTNWKVPVAYGDDGPRWIPQASPLLFQTELVAAYLDEQVTGSGFRVTYAPWRGSREVLDLRHPQRQYGPLPDFWWAVPGAASGEWIGAVVCGLVCAGAGWPLVRRYGPHGSRVAVAA